MVIVSLAHPFNLVVSTYDDRIFMGASNSIGI